MQAVVAAPSPRTSHCRLASHRDPEPFPGSGKIFAPNLCAVLIQSLVQAPVSTRGKQKGCEAASFTSPAKSGRELKFTPPLSPFKHLCSLLSVKHHYMQTEVRAVDPRRRDRPTYFSRSVQFRPFLLAITAPPSKLWQLQLYPSPKVSSSNTPTYRDLALPGWQSLTQDAHGNPAARKVPEPDDFEDESGSESETEAAVPVPTSPTGECSGEPTCRQSARGRRDSIRFIQPDLHGHRLSLKTSGARSRLTRMRAALTSRGARSRRRLEVAGSHLRANAAGPSSAKLLSSREKPKSGPRLPVLQSPRRSRTRRRGRHLRVARRPPRRVSPCLCLPGRWSCLQFLVDSTIVWQLRWFQFSKSRLGRQPSSTRCARTSGHGQRSRTRSKSPWTSARMTGRRGARTRTSRPQKQLR